MNMDFSISGPGTGPALPGRVQHDALHLARRAQATAADLERRARRPAPVGPGERLLRGLGRGPRALRRKLGQLFREHWDIGVFDVAFGSLKAFAVYPALYFAGLAWTIALMETLFLNTQLWTAGYLVVRRRLRSLVARRSLGVPLERLDALRERRLGGPRDAHLHRFHCGDRGYTLRVGGSRLGAWLDRLRGRPARPGLVQQSDLRRLVSCPEFRFLAERLRGNPFLYEQVLIARLLSHEVERARLLRLATQEPPLAGEDRRLRQALGEGHAASRARLVAQADALRDTLRAPLGPFSPAGTCLHWIHASQKRILFGQMTRLDRLEYALLADLEAGVPLDASAQLPTLRRARARIAAGIARAERWVERARRVADESEARALALEGLAAARLRGVPARRARALAWLAGLLSSRPSAAGPVALGQAA